MIAALCLVLAQGGLAQAIERVRAGDLLGAQRVAEELADPLERAQARVYVLHHAGQLDAALHAAVAGARAFPRDAWLAEREAYIAASLARTEAAVSALARLEALAGEERGAEGQALRADIAALVAADAATRAARRRAAIVAGLGGSVAIAGLLLAARGGQRMSSTPAEFTGSKSVEGGSQ